MAFPLLAFPEGILQISEEHACPQLIGPWAQPDAQSSRKAKLEPEVDNSGHVSNFLPFYFTIYHCNLSDQEEQRESISGGGVKQRRKHLSDGLHLYHNLAPISSHGQVLTYLGLILSQNEGWAR